MPFQHRDWGLVLDDEPQFPALATIVCEFDPLQAFGGPAPPGRTAGPESQEFLWDRRTGRQYVRSRTPLAPVSVGLQAGDVKMEVTGRTLVMTTVCVDLDDVKAWAWQVRMLLPIAMSAHFADPPTVHSIHGRIGGVPFRQRLARSTSAFEVADQDTREQAVIDSVRHMGLVADPANRPLAMALRHFHTACRLQRCGASPWEFMAEVILNYAKALESLFPDPSEMEAELTELGVSQEDISTWFRPIRELRNMLNVAHTYHGPVPAEQLVAVHEYTDVLEGQFRALLRTVIARVADGTYEVQQETPQPGQSKRDRRRQRLLASLERRVPKWKEDGQ